MRHTVTTDTNEATAEAGIGHGHTHEGRGGVHRHTHEDVGGGARTHGEAGISLSEAAASASVALDIGAGRGALLIYPSERFRGLEIEISRVGGDGHRVHTGVHERTTQRGSRLTAIFGSLPAAEYLVWEDERTEGPVVTVPDGAGTELRLS